MGARKLSHWAIAGLVLLGLIFIALRHHSRATSRAALENSLWELSYDIDYQASGEEDVVTIAIPSSTQHARIESSEFQHEGGEDDVRNYTSGTRAFVSNTRKSRKVHVAAEFKIELSPNGTRNQLDRLISLDPDERANYLKQEEGPMRLKLQREMQRITRESVTEDELLEKLFDFCSHEIKRDNEQAASDSIDRILDGSVASPLGRARTMVALCRAAEIPARLVTGFELRQQDEIKPHVWLEAFRHNMWVPFDPVHSYARYMPRSFIPARRDGESIVRPSSTSTVSAVTESYAIRRLQPPKSVLHASLPHFTQIFDLTRLPVAMHSVISLLLLLPLGALITGLFRNVIGIQTFGTFTPALLAMSFIYADWGTGLIVFIVTIAAGLGGRALVERLHLLMVPRLGIVLTLIILCALMAVSVMLYFSASPTANAVLFPLVILTIMIERFFVSSEEDGYGFALQLVIGTFVVSSFCYMLLRWKEVGELILIYPEIHLLTLAGFIALGRYSGYRLTELWRFRDLVKAETLPPTPSALEPVDPPAGLDTKGDA